MTQQVLIAAKHTNDLGAYLGDFMTVVKMMSHMPSGMRVKDTARSFSSGIPTTFESFRVHTYDVSFILSELNERLRLLEEKSPIQLDYQAYAEAGVFLKAFYLFFRILLDDLAGIIEYFYKKNEPNVSISGSFSALLKKANDGRLPEGLSRLLTRPVKWFPEMKRRRDALVHQYDSFLITIEQGGNSESTIRHSSTKMRSAGVWSIHEDIRDYFGFLLCEYQMLSDDMLDHFDNKSYYLGQGI